MANNSEIGSILKVLRNGMGYSQKQISSYLGISESAYSQYERGNTAISKDSLEMLANIYGVEEYDILTCNKPLLQADMAFSFIQKEDKIKNLGQIASFHKIIKNYLDMCAEDLGASYNVELVEGSCVDGDIMTFDALVDELYGIPLHIEYDKANKQFGIDSDLMDASLDELGNSRNP